MTRAPALVLDADAMQVVCRGTRRKVEPKVLACLELLWRHRNQLVTSAQLRAHVWPDVTVGEGSLARVIGKARVAVQGEGLGIRSRKGLGYVLEVVDDGSPAAPSEGGAEAWPFVGRAAELSQLRAVCEGDAEAPTLVVLSGEAGAGKSTLLSRALQDAPSGAWHFRGRCLGGRAVPPFWVWSELVAALARDPALGPRLVALAPRFAAAHGMVSALSGTSLGPQQSSEGRPAAHGTPDERHVEASQAFAQLLAQVLAGQHAVLVLEDIHWADDASLQLIDDVAAATGTGLRLVVSHRSEERAVRPALDGALRRLAARGAADLPLAPLTETDVREILERRHFLWASEDDAEALRAATGGNPLFVRQWLQHLVARVGAERELPPALPHVIAARMAMLPEPVQQVLRFAAVLGEEMPAVLIDGDPHMAEAIDGALASRLLEYDPTSRRYRFHHGLVRESVHDGLGPEDRQAHHAAAFRGWQHLPPGPARTAALATHGAASGDLIPPHEVQPHAERAAREAFDAYDFRRAAEHGAAALALAERLDFDLPRQAKLALAFARASWHADQPNDLVARAYARALELARRADCPELFAQAAIGGAIGEDSPLDLADARSRAPWALHLDEAYHRLARRDRDLRHRVASALCWMRGAFADWDGAREAARHVLERDPDALLGATRVQALGIACAAELWAGNEPGAALRLSALVAACGDSSLTLARRIEGHIQALTLALQLGDLDVYREGIAVLEGLAMEVPDPFRSGHVGWRQTIYKLAPRWLGVGLSLIEGELTEAGRKLAGMAEWAQRMGLGRGSNGAMGAVVLLPVFAYQGRCQMLEPMLTGGDVLPDESSLRAAKLRIALERGDAGAIQKHLDPLRERRFRVDYAGTECPGRPYDLVCMADACAFVGDARAAEMLYPLLLPWRAQFACDAMSLGSVARPLGTLARVLGDDAGAERHLRDALLANRRFGHRPERVRTELDLASLLRAQGKRAEADALATDARKEATVMGLRGPRLADG